MKVSRAAAIRISNEILRKAERERMEAAEVGAKRTGMTDTERLDYLDRLLTRSGPVVLKYKEDGTGDAPGWFEMMIPGDRTVIAYDLRDLIDEAALETK